MNKCVLVIAAHVEDEVLGCGGAIVRHVAEGDTVHAIFMTGGVTLRAKTTPGGIERHLAAAKKAHKILGLHRVEFLDLPVNSMDSISLLKIVQALELLIQSFSPTLIYTHHYGDLNADHRLTHQAVITACRPMPDNVVKEILSFEIFPCTDWASQTQEPFVPNVFVDISRFFNAKLEALQAYQSVINSTPCSRTVAHSEYLARHRGYTVGVAAAEAFFLVRSFR